MGKKKGQKKGGNLDDEGKDDGTVPSLLDQSEMTGEDSTQKPPDAGKGTKSKKTTNLENSKGAGLKDEETEGDGKTIGSIKTSAVPGGKKGKKAKKTFADVDWDDELKDDEPSQPESAGQTDNPAVSDEPVAAKKGKKTKKTFADVNWDDELQDDDLDPLENTKETDTTIGNDPPVTTKKGKKAKKTFADVDWDDELKDDGVNPAESMEQTDTIATASDPPVVTTDGAGGKKGKKKKKQKQEDYDDDIAAELEQLSLDTAAPVTAKPKEQSKMADMATSTATVHKDNVNVEGENEQVKREIDNTVTGDESTREGGTVRTAAQKRADKKEREKKRKEAAKAKEKKAAMIDQPAATNTTEESTEKPQTEVEDNKKVLDASKDATNEDLSVTTEGATAVVDDEDNEGKDDKKKKKKKKKDKEAEKATAPKTKKPGASAIKKMRENLELLRLEQKKREEEELAKQKAEEEAEQRRLEKLRLEQERREKKRQKEKERRERLKKEGKLLTKVEKEKKMKTEAQLEALRKQGGGVVIPGISHTHDTGSGAVKKPVRYGTRVRNKQKKDSHQSGEGDQEKKEEPNMEIGSKPLEEEPETEPMTKGATGGDVTSEDVPDNWDGEAADSEEDNLKDNWDDEDEGEDDKDSVEEEELKDTQTNKVSKNEVDSSGTAAESKVSSKDDDTSEEEEEDEEEEEEDEEDEVESSSSEEDSEEDEDSDLTPAEIARKKVIKRITKRRMTRDAARSEDAIRSPVVCVLGHVDTGKTKILDKIRHTNVQDGEAGGITQQIGATFVPDTAIREQTKFLKEFSKTEIRLPGLLIIDTPGHESFSNLRVRGSSMCDIAILVVDLMHGLEPQTIESLNLLKKKDVPFVVALNKIDRLFDWRRYPTSGVKESIKKQKQNTRDEFEERTKNVITELAEQGINAALFWEKVNFKEYVPLVPTSAISGDGMGDLIALLVTYSQRILISSLMFSEELECIVLEVKAIAGLGTTIDVILRNGILREGDTIVLSGSEGPIVAQIRALLMPQPLKELRVKNAYVTHKLVPAAQGVKITGKDLEKALAGFSIFVAEKPDEVEVFKEEAARQMKDVLSAIHTQEKGVYVQASTLGSLEALLGFLKESKIPYSGVSIGPVHKKDVMKCSVQLERDSQWAVILAFDVRVEREAQEMADSVGVRIFTADIIYHLFDNFMKHRQELKDRKREEYKNIAVFPCKLRILPDCVFNARDPIVVGVTVEGGLVKPGTPIIVPSKNCLDLGVISSVEANHKPVDIAHKGQEVAIKIESVSGDAPKLYGRHFDHTDMLVSKISRESIDAVKNYFREDLQKSDWQLMIELKKLLNIY